MEAVKTKIGHSGEKETEAGVETKPFIRALDPMGKALRGDAHLSVLKRR